MARRRRGLPVHGWVVLDKPLGMTSTQAVAAVRRSTGAAKAGHGGTLDPLATGLLPVALGEATKTVPYVMDGTKRYRFTIRWGEERSTDDAEGAVTATSDHRPPEAEIRTALSEFIGLIEQLPPQFSALKVDGARAYDLARAGEAVALAARQIRIDRFTLVDQPDADHATFEVQSGKGAYMRSLARDLARRLGTVGHIASLRRTAVGPFTEADAISLETLSAVGHSAAASGHLLPVETALDDIPALALTDTEANRLRSGQPVGLLRRADRERIGHLESGSMVCAMAGGKPVALARFESGDLRPVRVLNL
ncbi:tRNA pseudouridine(55) synthase TruB [Rhodospirillaceae bacterium SYSU D60014]|jgi:tRNA pseudouridine55 synthase|uniref:tRNA pseudouridine(55) synthase TruB n=1 Tax=Virgifigura deserti TaxID=2268457 RepID=UPI000E670358